MAKKSLLTLAMIVKNETEILKNTLPNLCKNKMPIIALDTGSTDNTPEYLRSFGVEVYILKNWNGDFAFARNALLTTIKTPWVLMLDADEYISRASIRKIIKKITTTKRQIFKLPIYQNKLKELKKNTEKNYRAKLFRADKGFKYVRPVNESLDIENKCSDIKIINASIYHWGFDAEQNKERFLKKVNNYIELFLKILQSKEYQYDSMLHYQLGGHYNKIEETKKAISQFIKAIRFSKKDSLDIKFIFYFDLIRDLEIEGKINRAKKLLAALEKRYKALNKPLYFYWGRFYFKENKFDISKKYLLKSLEAHNSEEELNTSYPFEVKGFWQYTYLGIIEEVMSNLEKAEEFLHMAQKMRNTDLISKALQRINMKKGMQ